MKAEPVAASATGFYPARVHPVVAQVLYEFPTEGVFAHPTEHRHFDAEAGCRDGLVGAFAAGEEGELGTGHGLAGLRAALDLEYEVLVDRTDHEYSGQRRLPLSLRADFREFYRMGCGCVEGADVLCGQRQWVEVLGKEERSSRREAVSAESF
jgi:hypothetical protein